MKERRTYPTLLFLALLLIVARAFGWITCSWWLATLPLWLPIALVTFIILLFGLMFLLVIIWDIVATIRNNKQKPT